MHVTNKALKSRVNEPSRSKIYLGKSRDPGSIPGRQSTFSYNLLIKKYLFIIYQVKANENRIIVNGGRPLRCACTSQ